VPDEDAKALLDLGVVAVYTPKDFSLAAIMSDLLESSKRSAESRSSIAEGCRVEPTSENRQFGTWSTTIFSLSSTSSTRPPGRPIRRAAEFGPGRQP